jgi:cell division protein FtsI/penicillin-binding protein 2
MVLKMQYSKTQWGIVQQEDMRRLQWFGGFISLLVIVVLLRIFSYQVWKRETWNGLAQKQYQRLVKLIAERGIIYDRNMQILAMDAPVFSIAVNPKKIKDIPWRSFGRNHRHISKNDY